LGRALQLIAQNAELNDNVQEAIDVHFDTMQLGHFVIADGLVLDYVVGIRVEGWGRESLRQIRAFLMPAQQRELLKRLIASHREVDPLNEFVSRNRIFMMHALGWQIRLHQIVGELINGDFMQVMSMKQVGQLAGRRLVKHCLLITTLALDLYREDRGELPTSLSELVPDYLPEVPLDPFGSGPLNYRRIDQVRYLLYSLGQNRTDEGGIVVSYEGEELTPDEAQAALISREDDIDVEKGDLFLDQEDWEYSNQLLTPEEVELAVELSTEKPLDVEEDEFEEGELEEGEADEIDEVEAELDE